MISKYFVSTANDTFHIHPVYELEEFSPHYHHFCEIAYFRSGSGVLTYNGQDYTITPPQLHFCPPENAWHSFDGRGGTLHTASMAIYPSLLPAPACDPPATDASEPALASPRALLDSFCRLESPLIELRPPAARRTDELIMLMCEEQRLRLPGHLLRIASCVQELLVLAMREQSKLHIHPSVAYGQTREKEADAGASALDREPRIANTVLKMKATLREPVSNAELARKMGLGEKYFTRLFTREVGISPQRYYLRLRLEAAAQYLIQTELQLSEIAGIFGFSHRTHFQACFKRHFGLSPSLYRYYHRRSL